MSLAHRKHYFRGILLCGGLVVSYGLLALWSTWPLLSGATTKLPLGASRSVTVPFLNAWTLWWNSDRALHGFAGYWDAPIFYPTRDTFAFSEPQPMTLLVAPVIWLTGSRVLAYNVYLWVSLVLNGLLTFRLLRAGAIGRLSAWMGGAAMILLPLIHWQSDVLQLMPVWGILWTWTAFLGLSRNPALLRGAELGVAFAATFFCSVHHALFLAVLLAGSAWIMADRWRDVRVWKALVTAGLIGGGLTAPFVVTLRDTMARHKFERTDDQLERLATRLGDYTVPIGESWFDWGTLPVKRTWSLGLGKIASLLALIGIGFGFRRRKWRRMTLFFVTITSLGILLSFGLDLRFGPWQPWRSLCTIVPGLSQVRNVFRFAYFVQMALVLLAAQGFYAIWLWKSAVFGRRRGRWISPVLFAVLGFLLIFEVRPYRVVLAEVPDVQKHSDWIDFLREQTPPGAGIACLPFAPGNLVQDFEATVRWMYLGTFHRIPLVNGYSGFFPQSYFDVRNLINKRFPKAVVFDRLRELNVAFVVIDTRAYSPEVLDRLNANHRLELAFRSHSGILVYRISDSLPAPES